MKKLLTILIIIASLSGVAQDESMLNKTLAQGDISSNIALIFNDSTTYTDLWDDRYIMLSDIKQYMEQCRDTIMVEPVAFGHFTINNKEIVTSEEMKRRGYELHRLYSMKTNIYKTEYCFIMQPSFEGFYEWLIRMK